MFENFKKFSSLFMLFLILILIITGLGLEYEDKAESPVQEHIEENYEETGATNLVESVLLDLRAYDTFGEVIIIYIAIVGVVILGKKLRLDDEKQSEKEKSEGDR